MYSINLGWRNKYITTSKSKPTWTLHIFLRGLPQNLSAAVLLLIDKAKIKKNQPHLFTLLSRLWALNSTKLCQKKSYLPRNTCPLRKAQENSGNRRSIWMILLLLKGSWISLKVPKKPWTLLDVIFQTKKCYTWFQLQTSIRKYIVWKHQRTGWQILGW